MENAYITFLKEQISDTGDIPIDEINIDINMFENNYIDSIGIFTLFVELEEEFDIEISLDKVDNFDISTIKGLAEAIEYAQQNN